MCESPEKLQELFLQKRESLLGKWVTLRLNDDLDRTVEKIKEIVL